MGEGHIVSLDALHVWLLASSSAAGHFLHMQDFFLLIKKTVDYMLM